MSYEIADIYIGQSAEFTKTLTESDVYLFAGITGAQNPMQVNDVYAKNTRFGERIVHGMLSASLISTVIGTQLPGNGTIYVEQIVDFKSPIYFGDTITARVEVSDIYPERNRVKLKTYCVNQHGEVVVDGYATVLPPSSTKPKKKY